VFGSLQGDAGDPGKPGGPGPPGIDGLPGHRGEKVFAQLLLHPFNGLFSRTTWVSRYQKGKTSLDLNEARDDGVLGCSGISWTIANYLHLAPDRQPHQHLVIRMLVLTPNQQCQSTEGICTAVQVFWF